MEAAHCWLLRSKYIASLLLRLQMVATHAYQYSNTIWRMYLKKERQAGHWVAISHDLTCNPGFISVKIEAEPPPPFISSSNHPEWFNAPSIIRDAGAPDVMAALPIVQVFLGCQLLGR